MGLSDPEGPDELRGRLARLADEVDVGAGQVARAEVDRRAARRATRTRLLAGSAAALVLVLGTVVVATTIAGDDGPSRVAEAPSTGVTSPDVTSAGVPASVASGTDEESTAPASTDVATPEPSGSEVATSDGVPVTEGPAADEADGSDGSTTAAIATSAELFDTEPVRHASPGFDRPNAVEWVVPWGDGFLASGRAAQPLPEQLPPEIVAKFPQEVQDLFAGELPATIDEAIGMLQEAGLYDEVAAIVTSDDAAYDAIYGDRAAVPEPVVRVSTDGANWDDVEYRLPDGFRPGWQVAGTGDRLALLGTPADAVGDDLSPPVLLATTTDLVNWDVIEVDPGEPPVPVPDTFEYHHSISSLSIDDDGWTLVRTAGLQPRLEEFLDGYDGPIGYSTSEDGFTVRAESGDSGDSGSGDSGTERTVTWEETGAGPELIELLGDDGSWYETSVLTGDWNGEQRASTPSSPSVWAAVVADDGVYAMSGDSLDFSPDGLTWTSMAVPEDRWPQALFTVDGTAAMLVSESDPDVDVANELYLLEDGEGAATPVDVQLPSGPMATAQAPTSDGAVPLERWDEPPVSWVLASPDARRWLMAELPQPADGDPAGLPHPAARNGSTLIVYAGDAWLTYDLS